MTRFAWCRDLWLLRLVWRRMRDARRHGYPVEGVTLIARWPSRLRYGYVHTNYPTRGREDKL